MSRMKKTDRPYDIVLFGATGFVGQLIARYLADHAPEEVRWAIAGRSEEKLQRLREALPGGARIGVLRADVADPASLRSLAGHARVVATTVGPYVLHGEDLVAACADLGTDYLDLTGEPEFVDLVYVRHDARARETGARLLHACGFDSVPHDLGVYYTVRQLPEGVPLTVDGFVTADAEFSGGTFASALGQFARGRQMVAAARDRARHEPRLVGRRVTAPVGAPRFAPEVGAWALPLPTIDPQIVRRSAQALRRYGPDFRYRHYAAVRRLPVALGGVAAVGALAAAAQVPAARRRLSDRLRPGDGPSAERRARSWFSVRFVGEGGGRRVYTEVSGGDPGYDETAKMFAEAALSLAQDPLPETSGQVTTAVAMGDALTDRLVRAGVRFRVAAVR
ncbi:saccharopine dehydrogenase NADP-binding domain-containing protein [Streptomyces longwoodensis]|uniref:saccharopine dehydrogenase family protein n=1 Tax=Streptomyces longwoodensis TaxID=68231 RepID=UPI002256C68A|nr:saccharopine dehydrogenase NADP-binding domain-containing protein [Streptomyces longwoodensis]MCX4997061.1 saccharopine dehydrogenase NADP-binding domain-containing protein [Streptomyces longwoodensis]WRY91714.1 saccharopine dehydrogenase NADP-binding domain-containing protein [Streptomyces longwoodensis]WTI43995.1 saccharopine dehydrogenase NADP-binding domain-containing protein [Streptomyces longwoodensis]WUC56770.1 saccharopine dehydrogenase NADP-binding domain-containing protein [Strepto